MGTNLSVLSYRSLYESLYQSTSTVVANQVSELRSIGDVSQQFTINVYGSLDCGGSWVLSQSAHVSMSALSLASQQQVLEFANRVSEGIYNDIAAIFQQRNEKLNLAMNVAVTAANIRTQTQTKMEQQFVTNLRNIVDHTVSAHQSMTITIGRFGSVRTGGDCRFSQEMTVDSVAQAATEAALDVLMDNSVMREAMNRLQMQTDQTNVGIDPTDVLRTAVIGFLVLLAVGAAALLFVAKKGGGLALSGAALPLRTGRRAARAVASR